MATQLSVEAIAYVDESRFERIDGQLVPRHVPGLIHSDVQGCVYRLLREKGHELGSFKVGVEWSLARPGSIDPNGSDYLVPDVMVATKPFQTASTGHLIPPAFLAVEIVSVGQDDQFRKAQMLVDWGVEHVWIINPSSQVCFEYHGGETFIRVREELRAGPLVIQVKDIVVFD